MTVHVSFLSSGEKATQSKKAPQSSTMLLNFSLLLLLVATVLSLPTKLPQHIKKCDYVQATIDAMDTLQRFLPALLTEGRIPIRERTVVGRYLPICAVRDLYEHEYLMVLNLWLCGRRADFDLSSLVARRTRLERRFGGRTWTWGVYMKIDD